VFNFRIADNTGVERHFVNPAVQLRTTVIGVGTGSRARVRNFPRTVEHSGATMFENPE